MFIHQAVKSIIKPLTTPNMLHGFLMIAFSFLCGCMNFKVEGGGTPCPEEGKETVHGSFYGFRWSEHKIVESQEKGLYSVTYYSNGLYALASVASLGLYVPVDVEWRILADPLPVTPNAELRKPTNSK
jgi:hypothetical protein